MLPFPLPCLRALSGVVHAVLQGLLAAQGGEQLVWLGQVAAGAQEDDHAAHALRRPEQLVRVRARHHHLRPNSAVLYSMDLLCNSRRCTQLAPRKLQLAMSRLGTPTASPHVQSAGQPT